MPNVTAATMASEFEFSGIERKKETTIAHINNNPTELLRLLKVDKLKF
jgi:hypothetical protein